MDAILTGQEVHIALEAYQDLKSTEESEQPEGSTGFLQTNQGKSNAQILSHLKGCVADALGDIRTIATSALAQVPRLETVEHKVLVPNIFSAGMREVTVLRPAAGTEAQKLIKETQEEIASLFAPDSKNRLNLEASLSSLQRHPSCTPPKDNLKKCQDLINTALPDRQTIHTLAQIEEEKAAIAFYETQRMQMPLPGEYPDSDEGVEMFFIGWSNTNGP